MGKLQTTLKIVQSKIRHNTRYHNRWTNRHRKINIHPQIEVLALKIVYLIE